MSKNKFLVITLAVLLSAVSTFSASAEEYKDSKSTEISMYDLVIPLIEDDDEPSYGLSAEIASGRSAGSWTDTERWDQPYI